MKKIQPLRQSFGKLFCLALGAFMLFLCYAPTALSAGPQNAESTNLPWTAIGIGLAGGLAFFLYGMDKMSTGMKSTAGNKMRSILASLTKNRVVALTVGAFVTMVIQSSSATTVMLVSFVQAGLLTLAQSMGVILGADIGTTITAQMIAFKLTDYALLMVAAGFVLKLFGKVKKTKDIGDIIIGFGILFFGMKLMSEAMNPLRSYAPFIDLMKDMENPILGILIGAAFTAVVQSSSATTGILIVLAQQGLLTLEGGIPILFGANIGTCVTAALACIGTSREAKRVAIAHILFKFAGVLLFIFWIPQFAEFIRYIAEKFDSGTARQIANAHTIFNLSLAFVFLPFTSTFSKFIYYIFPEKEQPKSKQIVVFHLDDAILETPSLAIDLARMEISRMAKLLGRMLNAIIIPFVSDKRYISKNRKVDEETRLLLQEVPSRDAIHPDLTLREGIDLREQKLDFLAEKIGVYLTKIARRDISREMAKEVFAMMSIVKDMESMGDIIHRNMVPLIGRKEKLRYDFCEEGKEELLIYQSKVVKQIELLRQAFSISDLDAAQKIMKEERKYLDLESQYRASHLERIIAEKQESVQTSQVHLELMDLMKQILLYSSNIAKTYVESAPQKKEIAN
jgi:phosphate:Na+ symporter